MKDTNITTECVLDTGGDRTLYKYLIFIYYAVTYVHNNLNNLNNNNNLN